MNAFGSSFLPAHARAAPRSAALVRAQLAEFAMVQETAAAYGTPDFASQLGASSLQRHALELQAELKAAELIESKYDGELVVDGDAVSADHGIEFQFLGSLLEAAQAVYFSLAAEMAGSNSRKASLPEKIIAAHTLRFFAAYPSSFAVRFRVDAPAAESVLLPLPPNGVLERFVAILDGEAEEETLRPVATHSRLKSHYRALAELLANANSNLQVRTKARPWGSRLAAPQARRRVAWLETLAVTEQETTFSGRLVGGSVEYNRFELALGGEIITGRLAPGARTDLAMLRFGEGVVARVREITSTNAGGLETGRTFLLLGVTPQSGEGQLFPAKSEKGEHQET